MMEERSSSAAVATAAAAAAAAAATAAAEAERLARLSRCMLDTTVVVMEPSLWAATSLEEWEEAGFAEASLWSTVLDLAAKAEEAMEKEEEEMAQEEEEEDELLERYVYLVLQ